MAGLSHHFGVVQVVLEKVLEDCQMCLFTFHRTFIQIGFYEVKIATKITLHSED